MLEHKGYLTRADIGKKKDNAFYDVHAVSITDCPKREVVPPRSKKRRPDCANALASRQAILKSHE
jgi:hypothetical protein